MSRSLQKQICAGIIPTIVFCTFCSVALAQDKEFSPYVDNKGNIQFPEEFRTSMVHLGSWFVPDGGASGFHGVYTEKASVDAFRKTGRFPDGATLVKELRASRTADYSTGAGVKHSTETVKQWFVMIKDANNRFSNNPLWGDGWGWALFKTNNLTKNSASDYKKDCLGCHVPAKDKDWVYTEAYPILTAR
ncbi:MAG: cytochrome P460 family protein [Gammaproteobacteria bacterium]|nr:cytochrome P460 family protein [Gammaproteobacteria bacterium]